MSCVPPPFLETVAPPDTQICQRPLSLAPVTLTALFIQEFICINNHHAIADVGLFSLPFGMKLGIQKY